MTTIYWFSGTGNSYAVARDIASGIDGARLVPLASLGPARETAEGIVGVVCPVYFYGLPRMVRDALRRLDVSRATYVFVALTSGGFPGGAPAQAQTLLRRAGRSPDAVYAITAPGNYIAMYDVRGADTSRQLADAGHAAAATIANDAMAQAKASVHQGAAARVMNALFSATFGRWFVATCRRQDRRFLATESCTRCGLCARVCPVANIELNDGQPHWLGHCEQCFACIHWCPAAAIQIRGGATAKRCRYHHPDVSADDIASQRG